MRAVQDLGLPLQERQQVFRLRVPGITAGTKTASMRGKCWKT